jgi:hypothetical protein
MGYEALPDRASDSGPDTQETPKDWYDYLAEAQDLIQDAVRCHADDPREHARKRIGLICEAMDAAVAAVGELQAQRFRLLNGISGGVRG